MSLSLYLSIYLSLSLSHLVTYLSIYLSINQSIYLPLGLYPSIYPSIHWFIYLRAHLPTYPPIYLSIHPSGRQKRLTRRLQDQTTSARQRDTAPLCCQKKHTRKAAKKMERHETACQKAFCQSVAHHCMCPPPAHRLCAHLLGNLPWCRPAGPSCGHVIEIPSKTKQVC